MLSNPEPESLKLVCYPHYSLIQKSEPFILENGHFVEKVKEYADRLKQVLLSVGGTGIGLAANQIGLTKQIFVCFSGLNETPRSNILRAYVNPKIVKTDGVEEKDIEGCLSFPGIKGYVSRKPIVTINYLDENGQEHEETSDGLQARCWLHEVDHLAGINIVDKFDREDVKLNAFKLKKLKQLK